jgi:G:T-mismatch repair DNA endonuclease (very short patch repair protein)
LKKWGVVLQGHNRKNFTFRLGITEDFVIRKYIEFQKNATQTADFFDVSRPTINSIIRKNRISGKRKDVSDFIESKKGYILARYKEDSGIITIARELDIPFSTLYLAMKRWKIKIFYPRVKEIQSKLEINKDHIKKLYFEDSLSSLEIGKMYGISQSRVLVQFKKWDLDVRDPRYIESSLERRFKKILCGNNITFEQHFRVKNRIYDFYIKKSNVLIETNGDYWHANPKKYKTDLTEDQRMGIKRDIKKTELAKSEGFNIIFIWESEMDDKLATVNSIIKNIEKYTPTQSSPIDFLTDKKC